MNLKNKLPVFVPQEYLTEMEKLSKAALMDMVWDYAEQIAGGEDGNVIGEFRKRREIILSYRNKK